MIHDQRCSGGDVAVAALACFDATFSRPSGNPGRRYRELTLRDLLSHIADMDGLDIEVSGYLMIIDGIVGNLGEQKFSKDGVFVSYDRLTPDQQKKLLE